MCDIRVVYRMQDMKYSIYIDLHDSFQLYMNMPPTERKTVSGKNFIKTFPKLQFLMVHENGKVVSIEYNSIVLIKDTDVYDKLVELAKISRNSIKNGSFKSKHYIMFTTNNIDDVEQVLAKFPTKVKGIRFCDRDTLDWYKEEFSKNGYNKLFVSGSYSMSKKAISIDIKINTRCTEMDAPQLGDIMKDVLGDYDVKISHSGGGTLLRVSTYDPLVIEQLNILKLYGVRSNDVFGEVVIPLRLLGNDHPLTSILSNVKIT